MKSILKYILVLAVMLGSFTSYANELLEVVPTANYVKKGNLISVFNTSGEVLYSGTINFNGNLTSLFNFTQLENGKYTVEITRDYEIEINTIEVKNNIVSYLNIDRKVVFKPVVRTEESKILISKLDFDTKKMDVKLYYEGELILSETVEGSKVLNRVYQLDKTLKGNYTAEITSNDRVFVESFRI
ncbi:hypothetical protein [Winogradskyella undariae]|uniref:hypothetical protein n=1 Tax=Winogradskyella undariae TaxID=1285465 RepID=UPI0015CC6D26|nr:hypothetical protein [Winogradskyella undariae]